MEHSPYPGEARDLTLADAREILWHMDDEALNENVFTTQIFSFGRWSDVEALSYMDGATFLRRNYGPNSRFRVDASCTVTEAEEILEDHLLSKCLLLIYYSNFYDYILH